MMNRTYLWIFILMVVSCSEAKLKSDSQESQQVWAGESPFAEQKMNQPSPCDMRMVIGIDPNNLTLHKDHWDVFNNNVLNYCDSIGIAYQYWSGDLGGVQLSACEDAMMVDLSKYQSKGLGYLLCAQEDWKNDEHDFKFVPEDNSSHIIEEIENYFVNLINE